MSRILIYESYIYKKVFFSMNKPILVYVLRVVNKLTNHTKKQNKSNKIYKKRCWNIYIYIWNEWEIWDEAHPDLPNRFDSSFPLLFFSPSSLVVVVVKISSWSITVSKWGCVGLLYCILVLFFVGCFCWLLTNIKCFDVWHPMYCMFLLVVFGVCTINWIVRFRCASQCVRCASCVAWNVSDTVSDLSVTSIICVVSVTCQWPVSDEKTGVLHKFW